MADADELVETVIRRQPMLAALADEPLHRRELEARFDISKSTCHRIIRAFDANGLIERTDEGYTCSPLGDYVADQVEAFTDNVRAAARLEPLVRAFAAAEVDFDPEPFTGATLTRPRPDDPSPPIHRYLELFQGAELVRTVDRTSFVPPLYIEEMFETAFDRDAFVGVVIYPSAVVETRYEEYPDAHRRVAEEDVGIRYRVYDTVPFGLTIYDHDHVGLRAYDDETGALVLFADTDDPDAIEWAEGVFEHYYERSEPATAADVPDWAATSPLAEEW